MDRLLQPSPHLGRCADGGMGDFARPSDGERAGVNRTARDSAGYDGTRVRFLSRPHGGKSVPVRIPTAMTTR